MATPRNAHIPIAQVEAAPKRGVSYTRYSTEDQGSTADQQGINEEIADEHEIAIVASFHDEGLSRSLNERPGLIDVFDYLETHPEVRYLHVNELERMTAGIDQRAQVTRLCKRLGITIVTEDMGMIDPHDEDKMHEADERAIRSKGEVLKIRRRVKRTLRQKVRNGSAVIMRPPYGVRMVPLVTEDGIELPSGVSMIDSNGKKVTSGRIELHPEEYPVLVQMFEWSAAGIGLGEIARRLNAEGIRTKSGKGQWSSQTVVGILDNLFYKGEMIWGLHETRRDEDGNKYRVVRPKGDPGRIDMKSPLGAIIDPVMWDLAKSKRQAYSVVFRPTERQRQARQVLDGRVYCLRCGHKMYGRNNAEKRAREQGIVRWAYVCHSMRPSFQPKPGFEKCSDPHTITLKAILERLAEFESPDTQIEVVRGISDSAVKTAKRRERKKIDKARAAIERAEDLALEGDISKEKMRQRKAEAQATIMEAEARIAAMGETQEVVIEPIQEAVLDGFRELVTAITDEDVPLARRVAWLDQFGLERVYVDKPLLRLQLRE